MWRTEVLGTDLYHLVAAFLIYSMIGWLVESFYMSLCNRKITNRGFSKGPFCPIYGFGGVLCYLILNPLAGQYVKLYFVGAVLATGFEFLVGTFMLKFLGELWWDYHDKPCNYKGVICLESTVAWGFYAIIIIGFLHRKIMGFIDGYPSGTAIRVCQVIGTIALLDFVYHFAKATGVGNILEEKYQTFKARWN